MSERMAAAARELQDQHDPASTMKIAVALLVQNVEGCEAAGVSLVHTKRRIDTPAASDDLVVIGNRLQSEVGEGPCLDAIWEHETVYVPDLATDSRWPRWGPRLLEATGMRSVLSFRMFTTQDTLGALNMYASRADGFSTSDMTEGQALAAHIAIAVAAAQQIEQLEAALDSRTVISQACGMLMERFDMDAVRAFALLTRLSSSQNVKVRDIAARLVLTRRIPGHDEVAAGSEA
jgi:GAF domain-containing protein